MGIVARILNRCLDIRVIRAGKAEGLKLVARRADPNFARGVYEPIMQEAISSSLQSGDVFYDVGANIGFFSLIAARSVGPQGRVYAFEPVPDNAAAIVRSADLNGIATIDVFAKAVGAKSGREELLLAHHIGGAVLASVGEPPDMKGRIEVDTVALDDIIALQKLRPPSLVKIDVEGAEMDVLRGMKNTIQNYRPKIIYEIDDATREGLSIKVNNVAAFMNAADYAITELPASYPDISWQVVHFSCVAR